MAFCTALSKDLSKIPNGFPTNQSYICHSWFSLNSLFFETPCMFELREKFEKVTFWPFLTPEKRNLVWPRRPSGQISGFSVPTGWNRESGKVVHCICFAGSVVLSRQNLKSGMPDFRFQLAGTENPAYACFGPFLSRTGFLAKPTCGTGFPENWPWPPKPSKFCG